MTLDEKFKHACIRGNIDEMKQCIEKGIKPHHYSDWAPVVLVKQNDLESLKFLTSSPELKTHLDVSKSDYSALKIAARMGRLEILRYLLETPFLQSNKKFDKAFYSDVCANVLCNATINGHTEILVYILNRFQDNGVSVNLHNDLLLKNACNSGSLELVQTLMHGKGINGSINLQNPNNYECIEKAAASGNVQLVEYLMTSPELSKKIPHNCKEISDGFWTACEKGHLEVVKFLCTSPKLTHHVDVNAVNSLALQAASAHNQLQVVDFLLGSHLLKNKANPHDNHNILLFAVENAHLDMVKKLIVEYSVKRPAHWEEYCRTAMIPPERKETIDEWFSQLDLYNELNALPKNSHKKSKHKI